MTMVVALGNLQHAILVSDRRLTNPDGSHDDESNKAFLLVTGDARMAIGFSGLAEVPSLKFRTRFWLPQTLADLAGPEHTLGGILSRLEIRCERDISPLRLTSMRLSIVGVGYHHGTAEPRLTAFRLSNFESPDPQPVISGQADREFSLWTWMSDEKAERARLRCISGLNVGPDQAGADWDEIYEWLAEAKPPAAIVSRAVRMIRTVADAKLTRGQVGRQCMSVVVPGDLAAAPVGEYHTSVTRVSAYVPGYIDATGGDPGAFAIADAEVGLADPQGTKLPTAVPVVSRNRPCPCGSGLKHKYCHGRTDVTFRVGG